MYLCSVQKLQKILERDIYRYIKMLNHMSLSFVKQNLTELDGNVK